MVDNWDIMLGYFYFSAMMHLISSFIDGLVS